MPRPIQAGRRAGARGRARPARLHLTRPRRRRSEEGARLFQESCLALIEAAPDIISITDPDGTIRSLSPAFERITGWSARRWEGRSYAGLLHPDDLPQAQRSMERLARGEPVGPELFRVRTRSGSFVAMEVSSRPLMGDGKPRAILSVARDATRRLKLEEEHARLAAIVETSNDAIISATPDGIVLSWNRGAEELYGFSAKEAVGEPVLICIPPEEHPLAAQLLERLRRGEPMGHLELRKVTKTGQPLVVSVTASAIRDASGALKAVSFISRDVTERKRAEDELRRRAEEIRKANEELELFTSAASHELREPIRKVFGFADLIRQTDGRLERRTRRHLERLQDAALRMSRLIEDLLEFSVLSRAEMPVEVLALNELAREAASELRARARAAGGEIELGRLPRACGNREMVKRVFYCLLDNALKFRKPDVPPRVRVTGRLESGHAELAFEDNGIGFDERHLAELFKPFRRLHGRAAYPGTGMGLSICKRIIERLGGSITARSAPGKGATFLVRLPQPRAAGGGSSETSHQ